MRKNLKIAWKKKKKKKKEIKSFMTEVPILCCANQWSGFYMIGTSIMKELN